MAVEASLEANVVWGRIMWSLSIACLISQSSKFIIVFKIILEVDKILRCYLLEFHSRVCVFLLYLQKSFSAQHEESGSRVNLMAHSGIGLWISMKGSPTICLYHTETFKHLQDINVASNVARILGPQILSTCAAPASDSRDIEREVVSGHLFIILIDG